LTQDGKPVRDELHGKRPDCPVFVKEGEPCDLGRWKLGENGALFSPQGGLRISARGLARIGRMLVNKGELDGVKILSPQSVEMMLAPAWQWDGSNGSQQGESEGVCSYGLATRQLSTADKCDDDPEESFPSWVGHAGDAYGLRSGIWIDRERGVGVAYFLTGLPDDPPRPESSFAVASFTIAEEQAFRRSLTLLDEELVLAGFRRTPGFNDRHIAKALEAARKCGFGDVRVRPRQAGDFGQTEIEPADVTLLGKFKNWSDPNSGRACIWDWEIGEAANEVADDQDNSPPN